jgi:hypothetical protein
MLSPIENAIHDVDQRTKRCVPPAVCCLPSAMLICRPLPAPARSVHNLLNRPPVDAKALSGILAGSIATRKPRSLGAGCVQRAQLTRVGQR